MTHVHSIRLRGFKTFARPTELLLEPGITVIIGPNGSGKSNIADAVLWVLGEQSPANLRGRNMQDVIFSGPEGRRSSGAAEVSLVLDNACGSLPLDATHVEISRRLTRDGGSEYRLNGVVCRLLDVQELTGALGLGREMHSVVSQGKVEQMLNSTPMERRALVEEAAGLGRFKKRRERAQAKLERVGQNLLRVSDIEREVRNSLRPLRQQAAAAERFAEVTEEWAAARARLTVAQLVEVERQLAENSAEGELLAARAATAEEALDRLRRQRADQEEAFAEALRRREEVSSVYHRAKAETDRVESRAASLRQRVVRVEAEADRARRRQELAQSQLEAARERIRQVAESAGQDERLRRVTDIADRIRSALETALAELRTTQQVEDELKDQIFEFETSRTRSLHERDYLRREIESRSRVHREIAVLEANSVARLRDLETKATDLKHGRAECERRVAESSARLEQALAEREQARSHADEASQAEAHLAQMKAGLEARRSVLAHVLERQEGLQAGGRRLLDAVAGTRPLTDVLSVKPGYERAVAVAFGSLIQAVVMPGLPEAAAALAEDGPMEVVWAEHSSHPGRRAFLEGPGVRDLWDVVQGPEPLVAALQRLLPRTAIVDDVSALKAGVEAAIRQEPPDADTGSWCIVSRSGEIVRDGLHAARRSEAAAEALLAAGSELEKLGEDLLVVERELLEAQERRSAQPRPAPGARSRCGGRKKRCGAPRRNS